MERYLSEPPLSSDSKLDILEHWRSIGSIYPTVARMARDLLAVFLTGIDIERKFNIGRDTCTYRRGHLQGETIRKIMILKMPTQLLLIKVFPIMNISQLSGMMRRLSKSMRML
jgi:hypothetical protein